MTEPIVPGDPAVPAAPAPPAGEAPPARRRSAAAVPRSGAPRDRCRGHRIARDRPVIGAATNPPSAATAAGAIAADPTVPSTDAVSTSWYCAEGTSTRDGRADETILIASVADTPVDATITVMTGADPTVPSPPRCRSASASKHTRSSRCRCRPSSRRPSPASSSRSSVVRRSCRTSSSARATSRSSRARATRRPTGTSRTARR